MIPQTNVRPFYKLIQCLHHESIATDQQKGNWSKAFRNKNRQLNEFIRPAYPNQTIDNQIKAINANWTNQIIDALHSHYKKSIDSLTSEIKKINAPNKNDASEIALARAKRNFGKKLKLGTIKTYLQVCKSANSTNNDKPTNTDQSTSRPHSPESREAQSSVANTRCIDNNPESTPNVAQNMNSPQKKNCSIKQANAPNREYRYNTRSSVKYRESICASNPNKKGKKKVHASSKDKLMTWRLEATTHPTLILGDSNLRNITRETNNIQIECFPGAKMKHITNLVQSYPNAAPKPENIIVSVGLNDHPNLFQTIKDSLDQLCNALTRKFPNSQIFIPCINAPENLPRNGTQKLNNLNESISKKSNITPIPKLCKEDFLLSGDNYHWTTYTGNKFLQHWLYHLNQ